MAERKGRCRLWNNCEYHTCKNCEAYHDPAKYPNIDLKFSKKRWTKEEIEALKINYPGVHARDIAEESGRSIRAVIQKAKKLGLKSSLRNKGNGRDNKGSNNPNWKS